MKFYKLMKSLTTFINIVIFALHTSVVGLPQTFTEKLTGLPDLHQSNAAFADVDNNGIVDIFLSGKDNFNNVHLHLYIGDDMGSFVHVGSNLPHLYKVHFAMYDFNTDGWMDVLISGETSLGNTVCRLYTNNHDHTFTPADPLASLANGNIQLADVNGDATVDILQTGMCPAGNRKMYAYLNKQGLFEKQALSIPGITHGCMHAADVNSDGKTDIILSGITQYGKTTGLFLQKGDLVFEEWPHSIPAISHGHVTVFDVEGDGDADILISGTLADYSPVTALYMNDGQLNFTRGHDAFPALQYSDLGSGDFNNDGYTDLIMNGQLSSGLAYSAMYSNNGDGTFTLHSDDLANTRNGSADFVDVDGDSDLDVFVTGLGNTGPVTRLLENNNPPVPNTPPAAPTGMTSSMHNGLVKFAWAPSADQESGTSLLSYQVALGTSSGEYNIAPVVNEQVHSKKLKGANGTFVTSPFAEIRLPEGDYFWKVRAVDNGYLGSAYSEEQFIQVCHPFSPGNDTSLCQGGTLVMTAPKEGIAYKWFFNGEEVSDGAHLSMAVVASGNLVATVKTEAGCTNSDTMHVHMLQLPPLYLGGDTSVCPEDTLNIVNRGNPDVLLDWYDLQGQPLQGQAKNFMFTCKDAGGIIAKRADHLTGCTSTDTLYMSVINPTTPALFADTAVCTGTELTLTIDGEFTLPFWTFNKNRHSDAHMLTFTTTGSDTIRLEAQSPERCLVKHAIEIHAFPLPDVDFYSDTSLCYGEILKIEDTSLTLMDTVHWFSADGDAMVHEKCAEFKVSQSDTFIYRVVNEFNCTVEDSLWINCNPLPELKVSDKISYCNGDSVKMRVDAIHAFAHTQWKHANGDLLSDDPIFWHKPVDSEKIHVTVWNGFDCKRSDSVQFIEKPFLNLFESTDTMICPGEELRIQFSHSEEIAEVSITMINGFVLVDSSMKLELHPTMHDTIIASYITNGGCCFADTMNVFLFQEPAVTMGGNKTLCHGDSLWCTPKGGPVQGDLTWFDQNEAVLSTSDSLLVCSSTDRQILVQLQDTHGCLAVDSFTVTVLPPPSIHLPDSAHYCPGDSMQFRVPFDSVLWQYCNHTFTGNTFKGLFSQPAAVEVTVTDSMFCKAAKVIFLNALPIPEVTLPSDTVVCAGEPFIIDYKPDATETPTWMTLDGKEISNLGVLTVDAPEIRILSVVNKAGCTINDTMRIQVFDAPGLKLGDTVHICEQSQAWTGDFIDEPEADGDWIYQWHPSSLFQQESKLHSYMVPEKSGKIKLIVHNGHCAADTLFAEVVIHEKPRLVTSNDTSIGRDQKVLLYAETNSNCRYSWYPDNYLSAAVSKNPVAFPVITTTFFVEATDDYGCKSKDSVTVFINNEVFIPNLFSPNADGNNDHFKVYGSGFGQLQVQLFSISGELLWESNSIGDSCDQGWDGYVNGYPSDQGTYIWRINGRYTDGEKILFNGTNTGTVQLIR